MVLRKLQMYSSTSSCLISSGHSPEVNMLQEGGYAGAIAIPTYSWRTSLMTFSYKGKHAQIEAVSAGTQPCADQHHLIKLFEMQHGHERRNIPLLLA